MSSLPAPNLDDRRFQDLVDEAKRFVQQRCPEWTDHNVSDPGVTMIELFASMVDQLLYRLNRVPERNYVKFLELIGVRLMAPTSAQADVTFWLTAPQPAPVRIPVGTQVATRRTESDEAIGFTVTEDLDIVPSSLSWAGRAGEGSQVGDDTNSLKMGRGFSCFGQVPQAGDALVVGLSAAVPRCVVVLRFVCEIEGVGVDPLRPPLAWEAWTGSAWAPCEIERDETGGFNRAGDVVLHVPRGHVASVLAGQRAGWLRCRVVTPVEGQPTYARSPLVTRLAAHTIGGTTGVGHAERVTEEILGASEGVPGQRFVLKHRPVVANGPPVHLEVQGDGGWEPWDAVDSFALSGPADRHFLLDHVAGEIALGPGVREADGTLRCYGAVPPKGAVLRVDEYHTGGGRAGNVARGAISVVKSSIPYIARLENRAAAARGVDVEDLEAAKVRGPISLRTGTRAVTTEDYEYLARQASPDAARVRCVPAGDADAGAVRVLVVPSAVGDAMGRMRFEDLVPPDTMLATIADHLGERRVIGARVMVEPPVYQGITVVARLRGGPHADAAKLQADALAALFRYFNPLVGGPGGGWPFGRPVHVGEVYGVLQQVRGTEFVEDARLFPADPITGRRGEAVSRIDIGPNALVFSYEHQVRVEGA